jgi:WD40 repeat protein
LGSSTCAAETDDGWTIEEVIQEKKTFDKALKFERYRDDEGSASQKWSVPAPYKPTIIQTPSCSNMLSVSVETWQRSSGSEGRLCPYIVATGADRRLTLFELTGNHEAAASFAGISDSPILSYVSVRNGKYQLATNMSGQLLLLDGSAVLDKRKDHAKYVVKVAAYEKESSLLVATAGWDAKVLIYSLSLSGESPLAIGEPVANVRLETSPESILFVQNPDADDLMLLASRRDSTYLYYYGLPGPVGVAVRERNTLYQCRLRGKQNLAPHSNAWVAFSPSCLALSPHDPGLVAVALSTLPHMKIMIVRLLFPSPDGVDTTSIEEAPGSSETQISQALEALTLQNREDAAIIIQANTLAPQTPYSTPQVVWRPDGSGLWVNGDDGLIRGIEAKTGKLVATLEDGHETGSKIRSIWAGWVNTVCNETEREEWLVSGGFDKRLIIWRAQ